MGEDNSTQITFLPVIQLPGARQPVTGFLCLILFFVVFTVVVVVMAANRQGPGSRAFGWHSNSPVTSGRDSLHIIILVFPVPH